MYELSHVLLTTILVEESMKVLEGHHDVYDLYTQTVTKIRVFINAMKGGQ